MKTITIRKIVSTIAAFLITTLATFAWIGLLNQISVYTNMLGWLSELSLLMSNIVVSGLIVAVAIPVYALAKWAGMNIALTNDSEETICEEDEA